MAGFNFKVTPHHFVARRSVGREVCQGCGLLRLRNDLTEWAVKRGCDYREAAGYADALRMLPAAFRLRRGE